jgi:glycosyltransferase involved in cell wall biosynthesis
MNQSYSQSKGSEAKGPFPSIAAIICTHNREQYLGAAIDSLLGQDLPTFEVWVVDNASTDGTRQVVEARLSDPRLHYVYEPTLGLSTARNRGAQETDTEILAYLDDDAVAEPYWLRELVSAYGQNPKLAIAGGKVTLIWPETLKQPPAWISANLMGALGAYDLGETVVQIQQPGLTPRGLNYSIRRDFLEVVGGFDINLGRVGKNLLSNEELFMTGLALDQGWEVFYLPQALVAHNVAPERVNPRWFLSRSWWQGVSEYYRDQLNQVSTGQKIKRSGERLVRGSYKIVKYLGEPAIRFDNLAYVYGQVGYLTCVVKGWLQSPKVGGN